jgi:hypothetical protein
MKSFSFIVGGGKVEEVMKDYPIIIVNSLFLGALFLRKQ